MRTLDMQFIRYMNLFTKVSRVSAKHCFSYNNVLIFVVPRALVSKAIGRDNENLRNLSEILLKRIRIVAEPEEKTQREIKTFIKTIVSPVQFKDITFIEQPQKEITIVADREGRARLIGRGRIRQKEKSEILEQYFDIK